MVCPYNDFKECFKEECPFYDCLVDIVNGHYVTFEHCEKAEKEKRKR